MILLEKVSERLKDQDGTLIVRKTILFFNLKIFRSIVVDWANEPIKQSAIGFKANYNKEAREDITSDTYNAINSMDNHVDGSSSEKSTR